MKKIFALIALFLTISFNANAQESNPETKATADVTALKNVVTIADSNQKAIYKIFYHKHKFLTQQGLSDAQKQELTAETETKLAAILSEAQLAKLRTNTEVYRKLIQ